MGSWADVACSTLAKDAPVLQALRQLGMPAIWKTAAGARGEIDDWRAARAECALRAVGPAARAPRPSPLQAARVPRRRQFDLRGVRVRRARGRAACGLGPAAERANAGAAADRAMCMPLPTCTASALLGAMRALLDDPETPARAAALAEAMRQSDKGVEGAAELVERAVEMAAQMSAAHAQAPRTGQRHRNCGSSDAQVGTAQKDEGDTGWGDELD